MVLGQKKTAGSRIDVRAWSALNALVQVFSDASHTTPYDLTGFNALAGAVKQNLTDTTALFQLTPLVSTKGIDETGVLFDVTAADGWIQVYAAPSETGKAQALAEVTTVGHIDLHYEVTGLDGNGVKLPLISGWLRAFASVREVET